MIFRPFTLLKVKVFLPYTDFINERRVVVILKAIVKITRTRLLQEGSREETAEKVRRFAVDEAGSVQT